MPLISVIVPIYNVEKYLGECLESLLNQTLKDIEIICVNDGSKDNSLEILKTFAIKDKRIKIIDKENSGYGASMNKGIENASGEFISIVESDDFIAPQMLEELYKLAKNNDCEIAKCDWFDYFSKNNIKEKSSKIAQYKCNETISPKEFPQILTIQPSVWSAIYKRDFLVNNNIHFLETPGAAYQDTSFSFKVFSLANRVILTDKALHYYRQDNEASSVNNKGKVFTICTEYEEIDRFLSENTDLKTIFYTQKLICQYKNYMWNLKRIAPEFRADFIERFSSEFSLYAQNNEITEEANDKIGKKNLNELINDKKLFLQKINKKISRNKWKKLRSSIISIKINSSRISIKLFNRQILNIG